MVLFFQVDREGRIFMANSCCGTTFATHDPELQKKLNNHLSRVEGQIRGIKKMIEDSAYCDDVLTQISSVQSSLNSVAKTLLDEHINSCIVNRLAHGDKTATDELIKTIGRLLQKGGV